MGSVDDFQNAQEAVAQLKEERGRVAAERAARALAAQLAEPPLRETAQRTRRPQNIALKLIQPIENIRTTLPDIPDLAVSIQQQGLLQPLEVRELDDDDRPFQVIAGRRRYEALRLLDPAGEGDVRCEVIEGLTDEAEMYAVLFSENAQRKDFTPLEYAHGFRLLLGKNPEWTAAQLARSLGGDITAKAVRKHMRLLDLPADVQRLVDDGELTFAFADLLRKGHAKGKLSDEEVVSLAEQRASGDITTGDVREQISPKGHGYVPPPPENYDEISRELDAAKWSKADRSSAGYVGADLNDEFDETDAEDGEVRDVSNLPVRAPATARPSGPDIDERVRHRAVYGTRQLESFMLSRAAMDLAPPSFLVQEKLAEADIYRHVWELSEDARKAFSHRLAEAMVRASGRDELPSVIFPAGA